MLNVDFVRLHRQVRRDRWLLIEAVCWLGLARFTVLTIPFRWAAKMLDLSPVAGDARNPTFGDRASLAFARRGGRALRLAATRTAWENTCLTRALAGAGMLRCRKFGATLVMGVVKNKAKAGGLEAHAWLSHGRVILTGRHGHERFHVVAKFIGGGNRPPLPPSPTR